MRDSDSRATFGHVVQELDRLGIGYLTLLEPNAKDAKKGVQIEHSSIRSARLRRGRSSSTPASIRRRETPSSRTGPSSSSPSAFHLANPDLVERFRTDAPLNKPDPADVLRRRTQGLYRLPCHGAHQGCGVT